MSEFLVPGWLKENQNDNSGTRSGSIYIIHRLSQEMGGTVREPSIWQRSAFRL
jgi:hypothetical protein